jgi:type II secretory pathway component PulJ
MPENPTAKEVMDVLQEHEERLEKLVEENKSLKRALQILLRGLDTLKTEHGDIVFGEIGEEDNEFLGTFLTPKP